MSESRRPFAGTVIGAFIRDQRRARGMTQGQLASLAGVGVRVVCEIERGKPTVQMIIANQILAAFGKRLGVEEAPRPVPRAQDLID